MERRIERASPLPAQPAGPFSGLPSPPTPDGFNDLYLGLPGSAIFLAARARVDGSTSSRAACLRALELLRSRGIGAGEAVLGGLVGIGGSIYALAVIGRLLDEPRFLDDAHRLVDRIDPAAIERDAFPDVACGSAGLILGLLALGDLVGVPGRCDRTPLEVAELCGDRLLRWSEGGCPGGRSGFSHGASGIATALARLARATGRTELAVRALALLAAERPLRDPASRRWRVADTDAFASPGTWCFGAPGLALARLAALDLTAEPAERAALADEVESALLQTAETAPAGPDHLCCGTFGRIETLLLAYRLTGRHDLAEQAASLAAAALDAAEERGGFSIDGPAFAASLFRGVAGIGLTLVRLAAPHEALPSPLCFEAPEVSA